MIKKQEKERDIIIILTDDRWWNKKGMSYDNMISKKSMIEISKVGDCYWKSKKSNIGDNHIKTWLLIKRIKRRKERLL